MTSTDVLAEAIADAVIRKLKAEGFNGAATPERKLLSIKQAAAYMDRSASAVRHMIVGGTIPERAVKRFGKRVFLSREELDRWLASR